MLLPAEGAQIRIPDIAANVDRWGCHLADTENRADWTLAQSWLFVQVCAEMVFCHFPRCGGGLSPEGSRDRRQERGRGDGQREPRR